MAAYQSIDDDDIYNDINGVPTHPSGGVRHQKRTLTYQTAIVLVMVAAVATGTICWMMANGQSPVLPLTLHAVAPEGTTTIGAALCESPSYTKRVLKQAKFEAMAALLARSGGSRKYEASDVTKVKDHFYVVYDNLFGIGRLDINLPFNSYQNWLVHNADDVAESDSGYEALVHDSKQDLFYVIQEAVPTEHQDFHSIINEIKFAPNDTSYSLKSSCQSDFKFDSENKGFEGAGIVRKDNQLYILALCEGNYCAGGKKGREKGNGRVVLLTRYDKDDGGCGWQVEKVLELPSSVPFTDYSAIDIQHNEKSNIHRVAVSSQESAQLWIGTLDVSEWKFSEYEKPKLYHFPRNDNCEVIHCNIEGVHVLEDDLVVAVADKMKSKGRQHARCLTMDQSISIFVIPE